MKNIKLAKELRQQMQDKTLCVEPRPGVYRWWFPIQKATEILCGFKNKDLAQTMNFMTRDIQGDTYIGLYFGISNDMRRRIRWHIIGPFKSSTLRRTLRAIVSPNDDDEAAKTKVNDIIDKCYWEWEYLDSSSQAEALETTELAQDKFAYPLNISKNKTVPAQWVAELKARRADVKLNE